MTLRNLVIVLVVKPCSDSAIDLSEKGLHQSRDGENEVEIISNSCSAADGLATYQALS